MPGNGSGRPNERVKLIFYFFRSAWIWKKGFMLQKCYWKDCEKWLFLAITYEVAYSRCSLASTNRTTPIFLARAWAELSLKQAWAFTKAALINGWDWTQVVLLCKRLLSPQDHGSVGNLVRLHEGKKINSMFFSIPYQELSLARFGPSHVFLWLQRPIQNRSISEWSMRLETFCPKTNQDHKLWNTFRGNKTNGEMLDWDLGSVASLLGS